MKSINTFFLLIASSTLIAQQVSYSTHENIHYYPESVNESDQYVSKRCVLDIYHPENLEDFPTIVWFHGGGLTAGEKEIPTALKEQGICVIGVNYRLSPAANVASSIADAAAAVAWVFENIERYGGDPSKVFVSGYSAGAYLSLMIGLDNTWLNKHHVEANNIAGLILFSGQTITHMTARKEKGIAETQPLIDALAPLYHIRADAPPMLLITGDRDLEMYGRYEENAYLARMMEVIGHKHTRLYELDGYNHDMTEPAYPLLLREVRRIVRSAESLHK